MSLDLSDQVAAGPDNFLNLSKEDIELCGSPLQRMEAAIVNYVEARMRDLVHAQNTRNLDIGTHPWPLFASAVIDDKGFFRDDSAKTTKAFLDKMKVMCEQCPEYQLEVLELSTTVSDKLGKATCLMQNQATGIPGGVIKRGISIMEWRLRKGKWRCTRSTCLAGDDMIGSEGSATE